MTDDTFMTADEESAQLPSIQQPAVADPATAALIAARPPEPEQDESLLMDEQEDPYAGRSLPGEPAEEEQTEPEDEQGEPMPPAPAGQGVSPALPPPPAEEDTIPLAAAPQAAHGPLTEAVATPSLEDARRSYWSRVLTGSADTVPDDVRRRAGLGDAALSDEQGEYRLLSAINRSWAVDHLGMSREQVRSEWGNLRARLARQFKVADDEQELFTALSLAAQDAPRLERIRDLYESHYRAALLGEEAPALPLRDAGDALPGADALAFEAQQKGGELRRRYLPLAREVAEGLNVFSGMEEELFSAPRVLGAAPDFARSVDELAALDESTRQLVYTIAQHEYRRQHPQKPENLYRTMRRAAARSATGMGIGIGQALVNVGVATMSSLGRSLGGEWGQSLQENATALDLRSRIVEETRRLLYEEVSPLRLSEEAGLLSQLAVDAAGGTPTAIVASCGGAGFATLVTSGVGEAVAEARQRAPQGSQELQYLAGVVGGTIQAAIYAGMSRVGGQLLSNAIARFSRASGKGLGGYSFASLGLLASLGAEEARLLLAGKAAHAAGLATQELAARVENTASNIDWQEYGDNALDIELNLREAATLLPFLLIGSGRVALRHFRSRDSVLGDGYALQQWGIDAAKREAIMKEPNVNRQGEMLREALSGSRRWSVPGELIPMAVRAMRLLNTDYYQGFKDPQTVADFLRLPAEGSLVPRPPFVQYSAENPEHLRLLQQRHGPGDKVYRQRLALALQLRDEWWQKAHLSPEPGREAAAALRLRNPQTGLLDYSGAITLPENAGGPVQPIPTSMRRSLYGMEDVQLGGILPNYVRPGGFYHAGVEDARMAIMRDRFAEVHDLSYQALLISFPLDSLSHNTRGLEHLQQACETARTSMLGAVARSVLRRATGASEEDALDELDGAITRYFLRRRYTQFPPGWMSRVPARYTAKLSEYARATYADELAGAPEELKAAYGIVLGLRSCSRALYELLPGSPDFQTALARGLSPAEAYVHLLSRELGIDVAAARGVKEMLEPYRSRGSGTDMEAYTRRNEAAFESYSRLTGTQPESAAGAEDGSQLWRVRRPGGGYTRWHPTRADAINDMVANTTFTFMPFSCDHTAPLRDLRQSAGFDLNADGRQSGCPFTGYDNLCRVAVRDTAAAWVESAPCALPGFELSSLRSNIFIGARNRGMKMLTCEGGEGRPYTMLVDQYTISTPLRLAQARFNTFWWRQLNSGLLSAERAGEELVRCRIISPGEWQRVQDIAKPLLMPRRKDVPLKLTPPPDIAGRNRALAAHLTDFSVRYLLANLDAVPLPPSAREWFRLAALCPQAPAELPEKARRLSMKEESTLFTSVHNRLAAQELREVAPAVEDMRLAQQQGLLEGSPLVEEFRRAACLNNTLGLEQGWCARLSGVDAMLSAEPAFLRLLESPLEGWQAMGSQQQESLRRHVGDICRLQLSPEAQEAEARGETPDYVQLGLQNLHEVLQDYPQLHQYNLFHGEGEPHIRMLRPADALRGADPFAEPEYGMAPIYTGGRAQQGTQLLAARPLEADLLQDTRVLPALSLLDSLRSYPARCPFETRQGIHWQGELYGGFWGRRPQGLGEEWMPETPLRDMVNLLRRIDKLNAAQPGGRPLVHYGVELQGLGEGFDPAPLRNITLYRHLGNPAKLCRLMPGEPGSASFTLRKPYVVQTVAGITMKGRYALKDTMELAAACRPLTEFEPANLHARLENTREAFSNKALRNALLCTQEAIRQEDAPADMRELLLRLAEDSGFSLSLRGVSPTDLTSGQAQALRLVREVLLSVCGPKPQEALGRLRELMTELENDEDALRPVQRALFAASDSVYRMGNPIFRELDLKARRLKRREAARNRKRAAIAAKYDANAPVYHLDSRDTRSRLSESRIPDLDDPIFDEAFYEDRGEGGARSGGFMESLFDDFPLNE